MFARGRTTCDTVDLSSSGDRGLRGMPHSFSLWLELTLQCGAVGADSISSMRLSVVIFVPFDFFPGSGFGSYYRTEFAPFVMADRTPIRGRRRLSGLMLVVHGRWPEQFLAFRRCTVSNDSRGF